MFTPHPTIPPVRRGGKNSAQGDYLLGQGLGIMAGRFMYGDVLEKNMEKPMDEWSMEDRVNISKFFPSEFGVIEAVNVARNKRLKDERDYQLEVEKHRLEEKQVNAEITKIENEGNLSAAQAYKAQVEAAQLQLQMKGERLELNNKINESLGHIVEQGIRLGVDSIQSIMKGPPDGVPLGGLTNKQLEYGISRMIGGIEGAEAGIKRGMDPQMQAEMDKVANLYFQSILFNNTTAIGRWFQGLESRPENQPWTRREVHEYVNSLNAGIAVLAKANSLQTWGAHKAANRGDIDKGISLELGNNPLTLNPREEQTRQDNVAAGENQGTGVSGITPGQEGQVGVGHISEVGMGGQILLDAAGGGMQGMMAQQQAGQPVQPTGQPALAQPQPLAGPQAGGPAGAVQMPGGPGGWDQAAGGAESMGARAQFAQAQQQPGGGPAPAFNMPQASPGMPQGGGEFGIFGGPMPPGQQVQPQPGGGPAPSFEIPPNAYKQGTKGLAPHNVAAALRAMNEPELQAGGPAPAIPEQRGGGPAPESKLPDEAYKQGRKGLSSQEVSKEKKARYASLVKKHLDKAKKTTKPATLEEQYDLVINALKKSGYKDEEIQEIIKPYFPEEFLKKKQNNRTYVGGWAALGDHTVSLEEMEEMDRGGKVANTPEVIQQEKDFERRRQERYDAIRKERESWTPERRAFADKVRGIYWRLYENKIPGWKRFEYGDRGTLEAAAHIGGYDNKHTRLWNKLEKDPNTTEEQIVKMLMDLYEDAWQLSKKYNPIWKRLREEYGGDIEKYKEDLRTH